MSELEAKQRTNSITGIRYRDIYPRIRYRDILEVDDSTQKDTTRGDKTMPELCQLLLLYFISI